MPHADPETLALWAIGESAGDPAEGEHLAECADCRVELAQLKELVAIARHDGPTGLELPPARVWDRIAAEVGAAEATLAEVAQPPQPMAKSGSAPERLDRPAENGRAGQAGQRGKAPVVGQPGPRHGSGRHPDARRRRIRLRLAAAAVAGIVIGAGAAVGITRLVSAPVPSAAATAQVQLRPLAQFPQWREASGTAIMRQGSAARVLDVTLSAPPKPGFYEVWLLGRDGVSMISLGDLSSGHTGSFTVPPGTDLKFYSRIDVSLQPFDGNPVHVKTSVVRGSLPAAALG